MYVYLGMHTYLSRLVGWLEGWILWHINLCMLFNAKSFFMQIDSSIFFKFSLACVHSLIVRNISISNYSVYSNSSNSANSV